LYHNQGNTAENIQLSIYEIPPFLAMAVEVSHGRGGAGNIDADDTKYVDGEVVRSGAEGSHGDGAFSSGRGGASFIADAAFSEPKI
jgi:hypothetical protein